MDIDGDVGINSIKLLLTDQVTIGIGTTNAEALFPAVVQPIVIGGIEKVNLISGGTGYGNSDVVNYEKQPLITLDVGSKAQLRPVIVEERLQSVIVTNGGTGYNSPPILTVQGDGDYAEVTPVVSGGKITEVIVNNGGIGFSTAKTFIEIEERGIEAKFRANIGQWNINNVERFDDEFGPDDSILAPPSRREFGSQYVHLYAPRNLRRNLYALNINGTRNFGSNDLNFSFIEEEHQTLTYHWMGI